ncbi:MAG: PASTA domain-containing protein [Prevotellaceae bacterium]|jgi:cell division protein FtsI (penicillin-binding protein 3)|nr:PASTA domain-containing protein [Prevotellaceae bacterium]
MTTVKNIIRRITLFYLLTVLICLLIIAQIIYLQFFTDWKDKAEIIEKETVEANRGNIYTHDMKLLATSIPMYEIRIDFYAMKTNIVENDATKMALFYAKLKKDLKNKISDMRERNTLSKNELKDKIAKMQKELKKRIEAHSQADSILARAYINNEIKNMADSLSNLFNNKKITYQYITDCCRKARAKSDPTKKPTPESYRNIRIRGKDEKDIYIDYIKLKKLLEYPVFRHGKGLSGLIVKDKTNRIRYYDLLARTVIGGVRSDDKAISGIEKTYDKYLRGKIGIQAFAGSRQISHPANILPEPGYDVVTTLDINMQEVVEDALRKQIDEGNKRGIEVEGGTAIVMETATGEIRAIANLKRNSDGSYSESYNYALMERSDPGSTFKLASLLALLDDGFVQLGDVINIRENAKNKEDKTWIYKGYHVEDDHLFDKLSVKQIFANSSNIGTAKLVTKYYGNNPQNFFDKLHSIGLFQKSLNLQIAGEAPSYAEMETTKCNPNLLAPSAYGYYVKLSPIHTLTFYNAVANNGKMMKPKFIKKIMHNEHTVKSYPDEIINDQICSPETLLKARMALQAVVDSGTAKKFKELLEFDFAGKTGTAQRIRYKFKKRIRDTVIDGVKQQITDSVKSPYYKDASGTAYQASFVGYIPADKPKYSIIVVLYSPSIKGNYFGSTYAVPAFVEISQKIYSSDTNWHQPVERNEDSLCLPNMKNTVAQQIKTVTSKLNIPVDSDAKNNEWVKVSKNNSTLTVTKMQIDKGKVPSVINMGLRDAMYLLEQSGLKVRFSGRGKVKSQSIAAGSTVEKGTSINLELEI